MPAYRQTALTLHALAPVDRDWIMARLGDHERARLKGHLAELKQMGFPADRQLAEQAKLRSGRRAARGHALDGVDTGALHRLLLDEPPALVKLVLQLENWHWRDAFVAQLNDVQRARLKRAEPTAVGPKLRASLARHVEQRLGGLPVATSTASRASGWRARVSELKEMVQRWL